MKRKRRKKVNEKHEKSPKKSVQLRFKYIMNGLLRRSNTRCSTKKSKEDSKRKKEDNLQTFPVFKLVIRKILQCSFSLSLSLTITREI